MHAGLTRAIGSLGPVLPCRPVEGARGRQREAACVAAAWAIVSLPSFWVFPLLDNWTNARPLFSLSWQSLQPDPLFWRPFEKLTLRLLGAWPALHPALLHLLAVLGHGLSGALVWRLARRGGAASAASAGAAALFLVSPAVGGAVWNVVGVTQIWSTAFGLAALEARVSGSRASARVGWLALAGLASLWKESGLGFFLAAPLFEAFAAADAAGGGRRRRLAAGLAWGSAALAAYVLLRVALAPGGALGRPAGRYRLLASPAQWVQNLVLLLGASLTTLDSVSLFGTPRRLGWALASLLAGLPLLFLLGQAAWRSWDGRRRAAALCCVPAVALVYLPMAHVSEKYAYPLVALCALLFAPAAEAARARRPLGLRAAVACFALAALAVDARKLLAMIDSGRGAAAVGARIAALTPSPPSRVCVVRPDAQRARVYSVFQADPGPASGWGSAVLPHWGWRRPEWLLPAARREECRAGSDALWTIWADGRVRVEAPAGR